MDQRMRDRRLGAVSPFRPPPTGKSISVAFALRACVRACERSCVRDDSSVAGADPMRFAGGPASVPPAGPPVQLSCLAWLTWLAWPAWPASPDVLIRVNLC